VTLPAWLDPIYTADEMRAVDAWAIDEQGVPGEDLMERAGTGLARAVARVSAGSAGPIRVVAGKGNNGGDGHVAARLLREEGREVDVLEPAGCGPDSLEGSGVVVDCLLGTGFSGEPREPLAGAIAAINAQEAPVVACDVPSGVDASTGEAASEAITARLTVTFHGAKIGLHVSPGALSAGAVEVVEIGIPRGAPAPAVAGLISERVLERYPRRTRDGSKFTSGMVVIAGGARGLTGAPTMAALAAQRAGAGYVRVAVPASAEQTVELRLLEAMTKGLPDDADGFHTAAGVEPLKEMAVRAGAVVLGPGLGRSEGAVAFATEAAQELDLPLLIDADGLNAHAGALESLQSRSAPTVLTPHEGELGKLLERDAEEVAAHRLACAGEAARRSGAIVLLKGDDTIVAAPGGHVAISPGGTPALATAGTGDVLSGLIGALLAKGMDPFEAASLGALAHVRAGFAAAQRHGADHVIAGDVIDALPAGIGDR